MNIRYPISKVGYKNPGVCILIKNIATIFELNEYEYLLDLPDQDYLLIRNWCEKRIVPHITRKTFPEIPTSYGLKRIAEREVYAKTGILDYVGNGAIKFALSELDIPHSWKYHYSPNYTY